MRLDELLLLDEEPDVVEYDAHGEATLPVRDRRPIDAGFVLTWTEHPRDGAPYERRGMVLALAPNARSVWVVPDEPRDGEGYAVVVHEVTADTAASAVRYLGGPGDFRSTAEWQTPKLLPRALLRTDRFHCGSSPPSPVRMLHRAAGCRLPAALYPDRFERGQPEPVEQCYVFAGRLHPLSVRPQDPDTGRWIPVCGECLLEAPPR